MMNSVYIWFNNLAIYIRTYFWQPDTSINLNVERVTRFLFRSKKTIQFLHKYQVIN